MQTKQLTEEQSRDLTARVMEKCLKDLLNSSTTRAQYFRHANRGTYEAAEKEWFDVSLDWGRVVLSEPSFVITGKDELTILCSGFIPGFARQMYSLTKDAWGIWAINDESRWLTALTPELVNA